MAMPATQIRRGMVLVFNGDPCRVIEFRHPDHMARNVHDYGFFSFESKADFLRRSEEFWNPDKTRFWQDAGVDLVIDRREGYLFWDMAGRRLIDLHLNGGTYNLGHRNPELIATLEQAMGRFDIGNHHFPALARTALAEALVATCPPNMKRVIYGSGGGEATDIAIKTARHTRQKRKIVSIIKAYHGHTGLAVGTGVCGGRWRVGGASVSRYRSTCLERPPRIERFAKQHASLDWLTWSENSS